MARAGILQVNTEISRGWGGEHRARLGIGLASHLSTVPSSTIASELPQQSMTETRRLRNAAMRAMSLILTSHSICGGRPTGFRRSPRVISGAGASLLPGQRAPWTWDKGYPKFATRLPSPLLSPARLLLSCHRRSFTQGQQRLFSSGHPRLSPLAPPLGAAHLLHGRGQQPRQAVLPAEQVAGGRRHDGVNVIAACVPRGSGSELASNSNNVPISSKARKNAVLALRLRTDQDRPSSTHLLSRGAVVSGYSRYAAFTSHYRPPPSHPAIMPHYRPQPSHLLSWGGPLRPAGTAPGRAPRTAARRSRVGPR